MLKKYFLISLIVFVSTVMFSQEVKEKFEPHGNPFVKVFANYHSNFEDVSKMEVKRAYLGYSYHVSEFYSLKMNIDVTSVDYSGKSRYEAFLKIAQLQYKKGKTTVKAGLIPTKQFKVQENFWGYRYIYKSFQDEYKMNASADLGASVDYSIMKNLSVDVIVQNGEGYKDIDPTGTFRGGMGITYKPIKSLILRVYSDVSSKPDVNRANFAGFIGYKFKDKFKLGAEYNMQIGNKFNQEKEYSGISAYTTVFVNKKLNVFARYDLLQSNTLENETDPWHINDNGSGPIAGVEYIAAKGIKISANYRGWQSDVAGSDFESMVYLNFQYSFK